MIIIGAIIISAAIVIHAAVNRGALLDQQLESRSTHIEIQRLQQEHEMKFAKEQAAMFHKETQRRAPKQASTSSAGPVGTAEVLKQPST